MGFLDVLGTIASPITSLVNGVSNYFATKETNANNRAINESNNQFNADQAQLNRDFQSKQSDIQNRFNAEQAQLERDTAMSFAREMFNKENEYNSPSNQLKLMREAGLNPNSFTSSLSSASANIPQLSSASGSSPVGSAASAASPIAMQTPSLGGMVNPLLEASQIALNKSLSNKYDSDTDYNKANINRLNELLSGEKEEQRVRINLMYDDLNNMRPSQQRKLIKEIETMDKNLSFVDEQIKAIQSQIALLGEQKKRFEIENGKLPRLLESEIKKNVEQAGLSRAQSELAAKQVTSLILQDGVSALNFEVLANTKDKLIDVTNSAADFSIYSSTKDMEYAPYIYTMDRCSRLASGVASGLSSAVRSFVK